MRGIFLDIETNGLDPSKHKAIDLGFKIIDLTKNTVIASYESIVKIKEEDWAKCDPLSLEINGFTWEQICTGKTPQEIGEEIKVLFAEFEIYRGKAFFVCQNPSFDRGFFSQFVDVYTQEKLYWPYHWLDLASMYWTLFAVRTKEQGKKIPREMTLSKNAISEIYQIPPEMRPHRAMKGAIHLIECYQAVLGVKFQGVTNETSSHV